MLRSGQIIPYAKIPHAMCYVSPLKVEIIRSIELIISFIFNLRIDDCKHDDEKLTVIKIKALIKMRSAATVTLYPTVNG